MQPLLARLASGEAAAFAELYDLYAERLYRYLLLRLHDRHAADEALQEVFVQLVDRRRNFAGVHNVTAYLYGVARHEALRQARGARRHAGQSLDDATLRDPQRQPGDAWETLEEVQAALAQLPELQREVVELKIWGELTLAEIAEVTGAPPGTVATRYRTALVRLGELLSDDDHGDCDQAQRVQRRVP